MIQRVQTLYLFLVLILSIVNLKSPLAKLVDSTQNNYSISLNGIIQESPEKETIIEKSILLKLTLVIIPIVILLTIALFKNRKLQMNLILTSTLLVLLQVVSEGLLLAEAIPEFKFSFKFSFGLVILPVMLILLLLAWRGVKKDDNLVKSYERMR